MRPPSWIAVSLLVCLGACPGRLERRERFDDVPPPPQCNLVANIETEVLRPACARAGCHAGPSPAGSLDLASAGAVDRLIGAPSTVCDGRALAVAANPYTGVLFEVLERSSTCGAGVTGHAFLLDPAEIDCLRALIYTARPSPPPPPRADASTDAPADASLDGPTDAGTDAASDAETDPPDAGADQDAADGAK